MKLADIFTEMAAIVGDHEITARDVAKLLPMVMAGVGARDVSPEQSARLANLAERIRAARAAGSEALAVVLSLIADRASDPSLLAAMLDAGDFSDAERDQFVTAMVQLNAETDGAIGG